MNTEDITIQLSSEQIRYLQHTDFLSADLRQRLQFPAQRAVASVTLKMSRSDAERFRSSFTEKLAKSGFGARYEVTSEGALLEDLIDRFHVRS